jgi:ankyrin repeat protein
VVRALLAKGANPNINDMGVTPFLVAAGVNAGVTGGTGLAAQWSAAPPANMELMELLLQHGANVNAQVTGTLTYEMRVSRAPSANEGKTALHVATESGKTDIVRYLLGKGAKTDLIDAQGHKPTELAKAPEIRSLLEKK